MQNKKITAIKVSVEFDYAPPVNASFEVGPEENFEMAFCNYAIPVYPMDLYVVTRKKTDEKSVINTIAISEPE